MLSLIVSTFLIFMFVDQLLLVYAFSQLWYLTYAKKQLCRTYRYKSLKSWKIGNIYLTQQFRLSILNDFRYQSIKMTWLLLSIDYSGRTRWRVQSILTLRTPRYNGHPNNTDSNQISGKNKVQMFDWNKLPLLWTPAEEDSHLLPIDMTLLSRLRQQRFRKTSRESAITCIHVLSIF